MPDELPFKPLIGALFSQVDTNLVSISIKLQHSPVAQPHPQLAFLLNPQPFVESLQYRGVPGRAMSLNQCKGLGRLRVGQRIQ